MSRGFPAPFHHRVCSQEIASNEASSLAMGCSPSEDKPPACTIAILPSPELACSSSVSGSRSHTGGKYMAINYHCLTCYGLVEDEG